MKQSEQERLKAIWDAQVARRTDKNGVVDIIAFNGESRKNFEGYKRAIRIQELEDAVKLCDEFAQSSLDPMGTPFFQCAQLFRPAIANLDAGLGLIPVQGAEPQGRTVSANLATGAITNEKIEATTERCECPEYLAHILCDGDNPVAGRCRTCGKLGPLFPPLPPPALQEVR